MEEGGRRQSLSGDDDPDVQNAEQQQREQLESPLPPLPTTIEALADAGMDSLVAEAVVYLRRKSLALDDVQVRELHANIGLLPAQTLPPTFPTNMSVPTNTEVVAEVVADNPTTSDCCNEKGETNFSGQNWVILCFMPLNLSNFYHFKNY